MDYRPFRRIRQPTTPLERGFFRLYQLVTPGAILSTICFLGYVVIGFSLSFVGVYEPTYSVMGFTDPFFTILSFLTGFFICAMSGTLTVLTVLLSPNDSKANFVVTMSLISFGFGAATMRVTFKTAQVYLAEIVSIFLYE
jgi:hypothetical protein